MEKPNFNSSEYRDNLAKDLKKTRKENPQRAVENLEIEKETKEYQEAHAIQRNFLNPAYSIFEQNLKEGQLNSALETIHNEANIYLNRIETTDFNESKKQELKDCVFRLLKDMKYLESLVPINESYRTGSYQVTLNNLKAMAILESMGVDVSSVINSGNSIYHYDFEKSIDLDIDVLTLGKMRSKFWREAITLGKKEVSKEDTQLDDRMQNFVENKEYLDKNSTENKLLEEITKPIEEIDFKYLDSFFDSDLSIDWVNELGENRHISKEVLAKLKIKLEEQFLENQLMGHDDLTKVENHTLNKEETKENINLAKKDITDFIMTMSYSHPTLMQVREVTSNPSVPKDEIEILYGSSHSDKYKNILFSIFFKNEKFIGRKSDENLNAFSEILTEDNISKAYASLSKESISDVVVSFDLKNKKVNYLNQGKEINIDIPVSTDKDFEHNTKYMLDRLLKEIQNTNRSISINHR
ncbi:hypothetical protein K8Q94_03140 [Candidatus Nomurabacteria bacterium]|nr:hypothetical protein [Candidatus Nomurabacteria bacterium]